MNELVELIKNTISVEFENVHTCIPGQFVSFDFKKQKATVQPLMKKILINKESLDLPVIVNVPVVFPRTASAGITFPINKGDKCLILFAERSIAEWKSLGTVASPEDARRYDISDAIAIPGLYSFAENSTASNNDDLEIKNNGFTISIKKDGKFKITGKNGLDLLAIIDEWMTQMKSTQVITGIGLQPFAPNSIVAMQTIHNKLLQILA